MTTAEPSRGGGAWSWVANRVWRDRAALAVLLLVPVVWLAPALRPGRVLSSADMLLGSYLLNQARPAGHRAANQLIGDTVMQIIPTRHLVSDELRSGRIPFWNPHAFAGAPLLGNVQPGVFDPLAFPYLFVREPVRASAWVMLLRLWVAGFGAWLLALRLGASRGAAVVAGVIYQVGGFTLVWLMYPHVASSVWFPWALLAAEVLAVKGGAVRVALLALALSAVTFGGHVEVAFFSAAAVACYVVVRRVQERGLSWRTVARGAGAVAGCALLTALLTAPQTLPFLDALSQGMLLQGRLARTGTPPPHLDWAVLEVFPFLFGRPLASEVDLAGRHTNFCEQSGAYVSVLGLALALLGAASLRRRSPWAVVALMGVTAWAFAAMIPPLPQLSQGVPVLGVAAPGRAVFVALLAMALLAARGMDVAAAGGLRTLRRAVGWTLAVLAGLSLAHGIWLLQGAPGADRLLSLAGRTSLYHLWFAGKEALLRDSFHSLAPRLARDFVLPWTVAVAGAAAVLLLASRLKRLLVPATLAVVLLDLGVFGWGFNPAIPAGQAYPRTARLEEVRRVAGDGRILVLNWGLYADVATYYGLDDVNGYDAIGRRRLTELMRLACPFPPGPVHWPIALFDCYDSPVIDVLDVRAVTAAHAIDTERLELVSHPRPGGYLYRNRQALGRVFVPAEVVPAGNAEEATRLLKVTGRDLHRWAVVERLPLAAAGRGEARYRRPAPDRIVVDTTMRQGGVVVVSDAWDPGWRATIEGERVPVRPCDVALMAVPVPAGTHQVELVYRPPHWPLAIALWLVGVFSVAAILLEALRRGSSSRAGRGNASRPGVDRGTGRS